MEYYKRPPSPEREEDEKEKEYIDYDALIPYKTMMPMDYSFKQQPIFQDLLDLKEAGKLTVKQASGPRIFDIICHDRDSPSCFYFSLKKLYSLKEEMDLQMKIFFTEPAGDRYPPGLAYLIPPDMAEEGMAVVAFVSTVTPNMFIRGYIESFNEGKKCTIFDVDTGSHVKVFEKNLHFIPKFLAEYPEFAHRGKLTGVWPYGMGGKDRPWWFPAQRYFSSVLCGAIKGAVHYLARDGTYAMWLKSVQGDFWIGDELIRQKVAQPTKSSYFEDLYERCPADRHPDAWIIENIFYDMPHPRYSDWPTPKYLR